MTSQHKTLEYITLAPFIPLNASPETLFKEIKDYEEHLLKLPNKQDYKSKSLRIHFMSYLESYCDALRILHNVKYDSPIFSNDLRS